MVVSTHDGQIYEDQADYQLDHPMEGSTKQPLRVTITPHMQEGESEQGSPQGEDHKLFFVRHGETEDNEDNVIRTKDAQLTDEGRKQAEVAAKQLKSEGVDAIVSSNLPRAKESAHIIAAKLGIVPQFDNQLNTWDMGKLEGQPCDTTNTKLMKDAVEKTPDEPVGGGESFNQFKDRSQAGIRDAINNNQGKKLAILTHSKVEATLKAWEKTGQDNPSIDPKLVNKEPDKPGSVEPFTMQANSTIMQGDTSEGIGDMRMTMPWHLDTQEFNEPMPKMTPPYSDEEMARDYAQQARESAAAVTRAGVLGYQGYAPSLNEPAEVTAERTMRRVFPERFDPTITPSMLQNVPDPAITQGKEGYAPVSDKYRMYPGKGPTTQSDTPLSRYFQGQGDTLAEQLMSIIQHPEQQTPMPGMAMPSGRLLQGRFIEGLKKMIDAGKSFSEIGKTLGMSRDAIAGLVKRNNLGRKPFEPAVSGAQGDPEYEKALSDWMKNQFEGGPIEGYTRLYRGETDTGPTAKVPDWVAESPEYKAMMDATGRWFNKDYETARYYNQTFGDKSGRVSYVDVPTADLEKHLSANQPEAKKFSAQGRDLEEYFLPKELADKRTRIEPKSAEDFNTANRDVTQLQRPANENKNLDLGTGGVDVDTSWKKFVKEHDLQRARDWNKARQDPNAEVRTVEEWLKIKDKEGHEFVLDAAQKHSEGGKTAIIKYPFDPDFPESDAIYHDGRLVTNPFK